MSNGIFHLKQTTNKQFYWVLRAPNGEPLCHSESYTSHAAAENGVAACKKHSQNLGNFGVFTGKDGMFYWHLKAAGNNETLCHSEGYTTKSAANDGALACNKYAASASIKDETRVSV